MEQTQLNSDAATINTADALWSGTSISQTLQQPAANGHTEFSVIGTQRIDKYLAVQCSNSFIELLNSICIIVNILTNNNHFTLSLDGSTY